MGSQITDLLVFWLLALAAVLPGLPLAAALFPRLPGRGLALARPLGLLAAGYPLWLLASAGAVPYGRGSALAALAAAAAVGVIACARRRPWAGDPAALRLWVAAEALFSAAFLGWALLRSFAPDVWQTEKPMDMAIVNAINRGDSFPPLDPWLAGADLNYYYFGHYLVALLVRVGGIDPAVGFNLAVPLFLGLCASAVFGLAATVVLAAGRRADGLSRAAAAGLAAVGLALVAGNLAGGLQALRHPGRLAAYDWWSPSRVIDGTANEFPFFSYLLGDLHAHVMVTPFALAAALVALQLAVAGPPRPAGRAGLARAAVELGLASLVLGSLYALNSLDYPTAALLGLLALLVWSLGREGRLRSLAWGPLWIGASVLLFLPFWLRYAPPARSVGAVGDHAPFSRYAADIGRIYGLPLWAAAPLVARRLAAPFRYQVWAGVALMVLLVLLAPARLSGLVLVLGLAALALYSALGSRPVPAAHRYVWLLVGTAVGLVALGEIVYLRDAFDGTPSYRFNTVFKAGYQAWFLLCVAAGCVAVWAWSGDVLGRRARRVWRGVLVALCVVALGYPVAASYSRTGGFSQGPTLDGMRWLERDAPGDAAAIRWLRSTVRGAPTVLEAVGPDFDPGGRGRVSTFTGLPTVIAWPGHETQWGHDPGSRFADVQELYATTDVRRARALLDRYGVAYVVVGTLERRDYPARGLAKFDRLGRVVFRSGRTRVYRVGRALRPVPSR